MSDRAAALIVWKDSILLIHRRREGREYYVLPGGHRESGETLEDTCIREVREETGLSITLAEEVFTFQNKVNGRQEHFFLARSYEGKLKLGGPERERQSPQNQYRLEWVTAAQIPRINLVPEEIRPVCLQCLNEKSFPSSRKHASR